MGRARYLLLALGVMTLAGCGSDSDDDAQPNGGNNAVAQQQTPANCAAMAPDPFVTRNDLVAGSRPDDAALLLRFVHLTDDHIIDDDGQAVSGASILDPLHPLLESAMRMQEEYTDETLNNMIGRINECHSQFPAEFAIITGDSTDLTTVAEARRYVDNMDGTFDQMSAFEEKCVAGLPEGTPEAVIEQACTRFTGRGVADTQSVDPDPDDPTFQLLLTRTLRQLLNTEQAALTGRAADGSVDPSRQTVTRSPGLPEVLRCEAGSADCENVALAMPWYVAFGNHDAYLRGTLPFEVPANEAMFLAGRHYMIQQHEFIDEMFKTQPLPGPIGHGFQLADEERRNDDDGRNDGYYAFTAGKGKFRMIVMNTVLDGTDPRLPTDMIRNPFALSDGTLDRAQFDWIKAELAKAAAAGQLAMLFSHHPDLAFAEFGLLAPLIPPQDVSVAELNAELASWPNFIAWVAGHTHVHRIRAFKITDGVGSNGAVEAPVECKQPGKCQGFWQIESASLIDFPQEQRLIEIFDNGDGTGAIRGAALTHTYEKSRVLAEADDRCQFYLTDPEALAANLSDAGMDVVCAQGQTRQGQPEDRNVELIFAMP